MVVKWYGWNVPSKSCTTTVVPPFLANRERARRRRLGPIHRGRKIRTFTQLQKVNDLGAEKLNVKNGMAGTERTREKKKTTIFWRRNG
ncbi:hypothetical protein GWI33_022793 [Rhynchophorus ferrugineus]|uniref:Uncharacterized protein n=1 Tax=Rhynchophorus ferrugineus TaxID=354439 RepID=A0A834IU69_RHYFE|nr:hypothetical protein GWI33_022793 [Rhynchophorus ferrugineus]